ncbi:MAG: hypothetical protein EHM37_11985, partial [Deltaproteobacteria bacterium]
MQGSRTSRNLVFALASLAALTSAQWSAAADQQKPSAQPSVTDEGTSMLRNDQKSTIGYKFTARRDLMVTGLGVFNLDAKGDLKKNGLDKNVQVGLWDTKGKLLASVTLLPGAGKGEKIASTSVKEVLLLADHEYFVGALLTPLSKDYFRNCGVETAPPVFSPDIFAVAPAYTEKEPGLICPDFVVNQPDRAYLGPVLLYSLNSAQLPAAADQQESSVQGYSPYRPKQGSTEIANATFDSPGGWELGEGFKIVAGEGRSGRGALFYERSDPGKYVFASQRLNLKPALKYKVGVWIRTVGVTGPDPNETGATLAVEFADSNDAKGYRGGDYATGVRGTQGWTHITMITGLREANVTATIRLYLRSGMTGKAWFDGVTIEPVGIADWTVYQILPEMQRLPLDGRSVLLGSDGGIPQEVTDPSCLIEAEQDGKSKGSVLVPVASGRISFKPSGLGAIEPGAVNLKLTLLSPSTKAILGKNYLEVTTTGEKHSANPSACWIDESGRTIVGGKPFMPIGFFGLGITPAELTRLKGSPFNTVMPYHSFFLSSTSEYGLGPVSKVLDECQANGIKVVYSLKDLHANYWGFPDGGFSPKQRRILGEDPSKG